jgi:hypothetical protein
MAHFATLLLFEDQKGIEARIDFARRIEQQYGEQRVADSERALVKVDGTRPGDGTLTYDKGGWVFWMLCQHLGRERCLAGLRSFIQQSMGSRDHPVLQDFLAHLRPFAGDGDAYDAFARQWFHEVVLPEYELSNVVRARAEDGRWSVNLTLANKGTGRMPVEVAAERGVRFPGKDQDPGVLAASEPDQPYQETRATIVLDAGEQADLRLDCPFEPAAVRVDPDALVLMLNRKRAVHEF